MKGNLKNSPIPAYQLPHRKSKTYTVPEVIKEKVQNSKPTPFSLPKTKIESEADKLKNKFKKKSLEKGGKTPKIEIKEENKGKFTATKKATGKTTEELTNSKNPITKKRAIFAQNAASWSHKKEKGGEMPKQGDTAAVYKKGAELKAKYGKPKN